MAVGEPKLVVAVIPVGITVILYVPPQTSEPQYNLPQPVSNVSDSPQLAWPHST